MTIMTWDETMSVRVAELDTQHREMVDLLNQLHAAILAQAQQPALVDLLRQLQRHCDEHFAAEEKLFEEHQYPGKVAHRLKHEELSEQVRTVAREVEAGRPVLTEDLIKVLQTWLNHHIKGSDKLYSSYLNRKGVF